MGAGEGALFMKQIKYSKNLITVNESVTGISIERKVEKITESKEPITDGAPLIYSERNEGVIPAYDVRTDRFEIALDAMDKIDASRKAKREAKAAEAKAAEAAAAEEKTTVLDIHSERGNRGQIRYECKCDCGNSHITSGESIRSWEK